MNILFIPGITITSILVLRKKLDNIYTPQIKEEKKNIVIPTEFYDVIPTKFTTIDEDWPLTTNLHCSICTLPIKSRPFPVPCSKTGDIYECKPNPVCDAPCASRYIRRYLPKNNFNFYMNLLKEITSMIYKTKCLQDVPASYGHLELRKYGGDFSQVELEMENKKKLDTYLLNERISLIN
jgi:hypothetical protein